MAIIANDPGPLGKTPVVAGLPGTGDPQRPQPAQRRAPVLLVEPNRLNRELLARLLESHAADLRIIAMPSCHEPDTVPVDMPDVVLVCTRLQHADAAATRDSLLHVSQRWPDVPRLMISERTDESDQGFQALRSGWQGFFPTSLDAELLVAAIHLIRAKGIFLPPATVQQCARWCDEIPMAAANPVSPTTQITERQPSHIARQQVDRERDRRMSNQPRT